MSSASVYWGKAGKCTDLSAEISMLSIRQCYQPCWEHQPIREGTHVARRGRMCVCACVSSFQQQMDDACRIPQDANATPEQKWSSLRTDINTVASDVLSHGRQHQRTWCLSKKAVLEPLIESKQKAHNQLLAQDTPANRRTLRSAQRVVAKAVQHAKEDWISAMTDKAVRAQRDGSIRWRSIDQLCGVHRGRQPVTTSAVRDEQGNLTTNPADSAARWYQHFDRLLNIQSTYDANVLTSFPELDMRPELDEVPTFEEVQAAIRKLHVRMAAGESGIVPKLIISGGAELRERIHNLIVDVGTTGSVVADWRNAEIVPIPKKGDLQSCDNWRGIRLLDVVGKIFARVVQNRLQKVAEDILPDSQCGFRKGRGCCHMIFATRQLLEKAVEHDTELYALSLWIYAKAYDSIPCAALWAVLGKPGVPPTLLGLIQSLRDGMTACIRLPGAQTESFSVCNGLRQGCTLAPTLFNLYFSAVVATWRTASSVPGVDIRYRVGRKLVGDRTAKSRLSPACLTELQFADDAELYTKSLPSLPPVLDPGYTGRVQIHSAIGPPH